MDNKEIAKVCHAVNTAYCHAIGDETAVPWEEASESQRQSALDGVALHLAGEHSPEESHQAWMDYKLAEGWKYGEVKDELKQEHPCLVSYAALPLEQRVKDYLFAAVVDSLAAMPKEETEISIPTFPVTDGYQAIPVLYVGKRELYRDPFNKDIIWRAGETRLIPVATAHQMLTHPDVFVSGEINDCLESVAPPEPEKESKQQVENLEEETRFQIRQMTRKDAIVEFCNIQWGLEIDKKGKTVTDLQEIALMNIDNLGLIENDTK